MKSTVFALAMLGLSAPAFAGNPAPAPMNPEVIIEDTASDRHDHMLPILGALVILTAIGMN